MKTIAPSDPILRKMKLPSIIRISDIWKNRSPFPEKGNSVSVSLKSNGSFRCVVQLKLEL